MLDDEGSDVGVPNVPMRSNPIILDSPKGGVLSMWIRLSYCYIEAF